MLYNLNDISIQSKVTSFELESAVDRLNKNNKFKGLGEYFIIAESKYNINAVVMTAISCLESKYITSELAELKNNIFGLGANDDLKGSDEYGDFFTSKEECIYSAANRIENQYLKRDSKKSWRYLNGAKDIWSVGYKWSTNPKWGDLVKNLCERIEKEILLIRENNKKDIIDYKKLYEEEKKKNETLKKKLIEEIEKL